MSAPTSCGVCGYVLDYLEGVGYLHTRFHPGDHAPVPVPLGSQLEHLCCDFCASDLESEYYVQAANDFVSKVRPGHRFCGDWLACPACAPLVGARDWHSLARRISRRSGTPVLVLRRFFAEVALNVRGPLRHV